MNFLYWLLSGVIVPFPFSSSFPSSSLEQSSLSFGGKIFNERMRHRSDGT